MDWGLIISEISFWYGLSYSDIIKTPIKVLFNYLDNLEVHRAEMSILLAEIESLPHSKRAHSKRALSKWQKVINSKFSTFNRRSQMSPVVHRTMLGLIGISVKKPRENKE